MLSTAIRLFRALALLSGATFLLALLSFVPTILAEAGTISSGTIAGFDFTDPELAVQRGAALGVSFILYIAFNTVTNLLVGYHSGGSAGAPAAEGEAPPADAEAPSGDAATSARGPEAYRSKFARLNFILGAFFALLLVGGLGASLARSGGMVSGGVGGLLVGLLAAALEVLGGTLVTFLNVAMFLGVWYGLKRRATEALVVGLLGWVLVTLSGLLSMSRSFSGAGLVLAGLYGIYYAVRARGATEMTLLAGQVPSAVEEWFGSSSQ